MVSLPHLRLLGIRARSAHSVLLGHLRTLIGALVVLEFLVTGENAPIPDYLPGFTENFSNTSRLTSINLGFGTVMPMRLGGPSGGLCLLVEIDENPTPLTPSHHILRSPGEFPVSTTERLAVARYVSARLETEEYSAYIAPLAMNDRSDPLYRPLLHPRSEPHPEHFEHSSMPRVGGGCSVHSRTRGWGLSRWPGGDVEGAGFKGCGVDYCDLLSAGAHPSRGVWPQEACLAGGVQIEHYSRRG